MTRVPQRAVKKEGTYGGRPLAETEEAHGLTKRLEKVSGKLGG